VKLVLLSAVVVVLSIGGSDGADLVSFWYPVCGTWHCGPSWWWPTCKVRCCKSHSQSSQLVCWRWHRHDWGQCTL